MTHRATRVFLVVAAFAAAAAAGYFLWTLDTRERDIRSAARGYDAEAERALLLTERLRAAQQSYVADGQGTQFWTARGSEALDALERSLTTLAGTAPSADMRDGARAASKMLDELRRTDARAREWIRAGDRLMASDLIFTESLTASGALAAAVGALRDRHQQVTAAALGDVRQTQLYALSAAGAICLVVVLLLSPAVRATTPRDTREALRALLTDSSPAAGASLRAEPAKPPLAPSSNGKSSGVGAGTAKAATPAAPPTSVRVKPIDVPGAARVCSQLARVLDPADLPGVLEHAAGLLDASGLIVWVGDRSGEVLYPMLAHGYPKAALAQIGSLHRDDDNATAAAYRLGEAAVVPARAGSAGAIVTPIVSPEGCVGVLAAEVRDGLEADGERRALAGILAAQLATLVTALPSADRAIQAQG